MNKHRLKVDPPAPTCFAFTRGVKVVVGAQQLALSVRPAVIDARRQVGAHVHLRCDVGARLESGERKENSWRKKEDEIEASEELNGLILRHFCCKTY